MMGELLRAILESLAKLIVAEDPDARALGRDCSGHGTYLLLLQRPLLRCPIPLTCFREPARTAQQGAVHNQQERCISSPTHLTEPPPVGRG